MGRQTVKLTHISELTKNKVTEKTYGDDDFWTKRTIKDEKIEQRKRTIENGKFKAR